MKKGDGVSTAGKGSSRGAKILEGWRDD